MMNTEISVFSTLPCSPNNRLNAWNEWVSSRLGNCVVDAKKEFNASFKVLNYGSVSLSIVEGDAAILSTSASLHPSVSNNKYRFLLVHNKNCQAKYTFEDRIETVDDDSFMLVDLSKPVSCNIPTDSKYISMICLQEEDVLSREPTIEQAIGNKISLQKGSGGILKYYIDSIWRGDDISVERGGQVLLDVIDLALHDALKTTNQDLIDRQRYFADVVGYIKSNLCDPDLTTSDIAQYCGVSSRSIQLLFADRLTTPTRFIRDQRLDKVAARLTQSNQSISNLAFDMGFGDYSQFCHAFKEKFGLSPSQYRRQFLRS